MQAIVNGKIVTPSGVVENQILLFQQTVVGIESALPEGCEVIGEVHHSVLFAGVTIEAGAKVYDSVIMPGVVVRAGAVIHRAIGGENSDITGGAQVGRPYDEGEENAIALVGQNTVLPENFVVNPGDQIDSDVLALERSADE